MWEDELTRKLEAAVIGGSSDPATVHFLLEHPMLKPGSEGPVPMSDREMLATLPSSVVNWHDDECEACQGNDAERSCRGSSTFSGLIRKVRRCKCRLRALCPRCACSLPSLCVLDQGTLPTCCVVFPAFCDRALGAAV